MLRNKLIYIAGKYGSENKEKTIENANIARQIGIKVWNYGAIGIVPHYNTFLFDYEEKNTTKYEEFIEGDLSIINQCDALFLLKGWSKSKGANIEYNHALKNRIPLLYTNSQLKEFIGKTQDSCFFCKKIRIGMISKYSIKICQNCIEKADTLETGYLQYFNKDFFFPTKKALEGTIY